MGEINPKIDVKLFSNIMTLYIEFEVMAVGNEQFLLCESEQQKLLKSVIHLTGTLTPITSSTNHSICSL
jgi:hypothetical protein